MDYDAAVELVVRLVCAIRRVDAGQFDPGADLVESLGFDSLDAAELAAVIHRETGSELAVSSFEDLRTVESIARHMSEVKAVS
jgi:acyl carrier protein